MEDIQISILWHVSFLLHFRIQCRNGSCPDRIKALNNLNQCKRREIIGRTRSRQLRPFNYLDELLLRLCIWDNVFLLGSLSNLRLRGIVLCLITRRAIFYQLEEYFVTIAEKYRLLGVVKDGFIFLCFRSLERLNRLELTFL